MDRWSFWTGAFCTWIALQGFTWSLYTGLNVFVSVWFFQTICGFRLWHTNYLMISDSWRMLEYGHFEKSSLGNEKKGKRNCLAQGTCHMMNDLYQISGMSVLRPKTLILEFKMPQPSKNYPNACFWQCILIGAFSAVDTIFYTYHLFIKKWYPLFSCILLNVLPTMPWHLCRHFMKIIHIYLTKRYVRKTDSLYPYNLHVSKSVPIMALPRWFVQLR